jgi:hypothetical protein
MNKKSLIFGILVTAIWFIGIYGFTKSNGYSLPIELNALGDFLAGIFAPVAFFWLILGYVQQGKQLDQIDEMRSGIRQQGELTRLQLEQLRMTNNASNPYLELSSQEMKIHEVRDLLSNKMEMLGSLEFNVCSKVNESRFVLLMTTDNTIYQRIVKIGVDDVVKFTLRLDCLNDSLINDFLKKKIDDTSIQFKIRFQNIYGLETENIYSYRMFRHSTGEIQVLKPRLRDSLMKSTVL